MTDASVVARFDAGCWPLLLSAVPHGVFCSRFCFLADFTQISRHPADAGWVSTIICATFSCSAREDALVGAGTAGSRIAGTLFQFMPSSQVRRAASASPISTAARSACRLDGNRRRPVGSETLRSREVIKGLARPSRRAERRALDGVAAAEKGGFQEVDGAAGRRRPSADERPFSRLRTTTSARPSPPPLTEAKARNRLAADRVVKTARPGAVAGRAGDDHQRDQVLLARMAGARGGRLASSGSAAPRASWGRHLVAVSSSQASKASEARPSPSKKWRRS